MAQTANELLGGILVTLKSIDNKTGSGGSGSSDAGSKSILTSMLGTFGKRKEAGKNIVTFAGEIAQIAKDSDPKKLMEFSKGLVVFGTSLPGIAQGMNDLGNIKARKVSRATNVLRKLFEFFEEMGDNKSQKRINKTLVTFGAMGMAIKRIAKPLNSMAFLLLKFGLSIIGFVGSLLIASVLLGSTNPLYAIGAIVAIIGGFVGLMVLLGRLKGPIKRGSKVLKNMAIGMLALPIALVLFVGALILIPKILKIGGSPEESLGKTMLLIGGIILGSVLLMSFIGLLKKKVVKGAAVMGAVAIGIIILAGAAVVVSLAAKAISSIAGMGTETTGKKEKNQTLLGMEVPPFVYGLGTMGLILLGGLALIAVFSAGSAFWLIGVGVALAFAISLIGLAWSVRELVSVASELKDVDVAGVVGHLISGTLIGFSNGIMWGLMGKKVTGNESPVDTLVMAALIPVRIAAMMAGIGLLTGVSVALSLFALSLKAFEKVGKIVPIMGYNADGKPIYGKPVTVAQVATNIANAIGVFFITLGDLFDPTRGKSPLPSPKQMDQIVYALMGSGGFSVFGVQVARSGPNLMDALYQFGDVLSYWGKFGDQGKIPMGTNPKTGEPIEGPTTVKVADNIVKTLVKFINGLSSGILNLKKDIGDKAMQVAYLLLGKKNTGALGWLGNITGFTSDKPGILEPVAKFGEIIKQFAEGRIAVGTKADGSTEYEDIDYKKTADKIVAGIQDFTIALADGLNKQAGSDINYGKKATQAGEVLAEFEDLFTGLEKLSNAQSGLDKLATSLNDVGQGIGLIAENVGALDADKFNSIANTAANYRKKTADLEPLPEGGANASGGRTGSSLQDAPDWDNISSMIGQQVGQQVSAALSTGQFKFEFQSPTGGIMTLEQD